MDTPPFRLHALGDPSLFGPSGALQGRAAHRKRIAMLAVLALARGRPVGRERLMGLLWPEQPAERARHSLSESLYVVRRELADAALSAGPAGDVALDPGVVGSDVAEFQEALEAGDRARAVRLYRGPLLDGFYLPDAPGFDRWVEEERDRLARAYADAVRALAEAAEEEGSHDAAAGWWRRLAATDPFNARTALRLARALDAAGERAAALRAARDHASRVRGELGVEPDAALLAWMDEAARVRPATAPPAPVPAVEPRSTELSPAPVESVAAARGGPSPAADAGPGTAETGAAAAAAGGDRAEADARDAGGAGTVWGEGATGGPWGRRRRAAGAAAGLAAGVLLSVAMRAAGGPAVPAELAADDPRRVAVLVLEDLSPGGELGPLASGITERLIGELSQVPALEVRPLAAVAAYRGGGTRFADMVGELRVGTVVEGTLQRSGDSVWVTLSLVNASTRRRLQTHEAVLPADGGVAPARDLAHEVSAVVRRRLGAEVRLRAAVRARDADARLLVQRAEQLRSDARQVGGAGHPADVQSALDLLSDSDSLLARAWQGGDGGVRSTLARGWNDAIRARLHPEKPAVAERLLRAAQARADSVLARGDTSAARALELRGRALYWRGVATSDSVRQRALLDAAERDLRRATAARPGLAGAWAALSQLLRLRGRLAEGELAARRALAEDAYLDDGADIRYILFYSALWTGDYPRADEECAAGRRLFPQDYRFVECGLTLLRNDPSRPPRPADAWALAAELDRLDPPAHARQAGRPYSPVYRRMLAAAVSARAGDAGRARAELARARHETRASPPLSLSLNYDEMWVREMLGDTAAARRLLREMQRSRPWMATYLSRDPFVRAMGGTVAMGLGPPR